MRRGQGWWWVVARGDGWSREVARGRARSREISLSCAMRTVMMRSQRLRVMFEMSPPIPPGTQPTTNSTNMAAHNFESSGSRLKQGRQIPQHVGCGPTSSRSFPPAVVTSTSAAGAAASELEGAGGAGAGASGASAAVTAAGSADSMWAWSRAWARLARAEASHGDENSEYFDRDRQNTPFAYPGSSASPLPAVSVERNGGQLAFA